MNAFAFSVEYKTKVITITDNRLNFIFKSLFKMATVELKNIVL